MQIPQCKIARAALGWKLPDLARASGIDARNIARFEAGETVLPRQVEAIRGAFEQQGVEFFDQGEAAGAVRLREKGPQSVIARADHE